MRDLSTVDEVQMLWRPLTDEEVERVNALLPVVSDLLRQEADNRGKDIDAMIEKDELRHNVVASVVTDIIRRYINTVGDDSAPRTQYAQSALGYSSSGTFLVPGGGMFIKNAELSRLGLRRARVGSVDFD